MSLTRDDWARMWEAVSTIEHNLHYINITHFNTVRKERAEIKKQCEFIKEQIQSVIGQME